MSKPITGRPPRNDKPKKHTIYIAEASVEKAEKMAKKEKTPFGRFLEKIIDEAKETRDLEKLKRLAAKRKLTQAAR